MYNSNNVRIVSHEPIDGKEGAIRENRDIASSSQILERMEKRMKISETDVGAELTRQVNDLKALLKAFKMGVVKEDHKKQG